MNGTKAQTQRTMQTTNRDPAEQPTGRLPARQLERNCSLSESLGALSATLGETSRPSCAPHPPCGRRHRIRLCVGIGSLAAEPRACGHYRGFGGSSR